MQARVAGTGHVNIETRLAIYADGYRSRLVEALDANFPCLHKGLGDDDFAQLARAYLDAHPSQHYSIRWFGHRLPAFMAATSPWNEQPFAGELATFEWAMSEAFDAADATVVTLAQMAAVAPEHWPDMQFAFHPSLHQLSLQWNTPPIWRALSRDETPETPEQAETAVAWITWRQDYSLFHRHLEVDEAWALEAARRSENYSVLCEGLCTWVDAEHVALRAVGFLRQWVSDGLITQINTRTA